MTDSTAVEPSSLLSISALYVPEFLTITNGYTEVTVTRIPWVTQWNGGHGLVWDGGWFTRMMEGWEDECYWWKCLAS